MEPTPASENGRQSRGLSRFWPVHGTPVPVQRQSAEDVPRPDDLRSDQASTADMSELSDGAPQNEGGSGVAGSDAAGAGATSHGGFRSDMAGSRETGPAESRSAEWRSPDSWSDGTWSVRPSLPVFGGPTGPARRPWATGPGTTPNPGQPPRADRPGASHPTGSGDHPGDVEPSDHVDRLAPVDPPRFADDPRYPGRFRNPDQFEHGRRTGTHVAEPATDPTGEQPLIDPQSALDPGSPESGDSRFTSPASDSAADSPTSRRDPSFRPYRSADVGRHPALTGETQMVALGSRRAGESRPRTEPTAEPMGADPDAITRAGTTPTETGPTGTEDGDTGHAHTGHADTGAGPTTTEPTTAGPAAMGPAGAGPRTAGPAPTDPSPSRPTRVGTTGMAPTRVATEEAGAADVPDPKPVDPLEHAPARGHAQAESQAAARRPAKAGGPPEARRPAEADGPPEARRPAETGRRAEARGRAEVRNGGTGWPTPAGPPAAPDVIDRSGGADTPGGVQPSNDGAYSDGAYGGGRRSRDDAYGDREPSGTPAGQRPFTVEDRRTPVAAGTYGTGSSDAGGPVVVAPMRPGDVEQARVTFWHDEATRQFHADWHEVKAQFVDDPVAALTRASDLLTEAVQELTASMLAERDELDPLRRTSTPDTESMRMAMRNYQEFLDRILSL